MARGTDEGAKAPTPRGNEAPVLSLAEKRPR
jgi:hypothetical protein